LAFGLLAFEICGGIAAADPLPPALAPTPAPAPTAASPSAPQTWVAVTGRVFNNVTGYYVRSAEVRLAGTNNIVYTEDGGAYRIEVPAGTVTLTASYSGVQSSTLTLDARPGAPNILDFELRAIGAGTGAGGSDDVVMLERFEVSAERIGQAKAIQEQRAAVNAKIVIATDNFGELTQGNMGEFLKYMPGITLDYGEVDATGVRIGGLDPKYTGFSADGINLATAQGGGSRALNINDVSITGIEAIEFNQTLTASMDPGSAAGNINLKSKYSFNIRKNTFRYQIGLDGTSDALDFGRDYMPDDKLHRRIFPGGMLNYGGTFLNKRLGVEVSVSDYTSYTLQTYNQVRYSYYTGDLPDYLVNSPVITGITWRPGPKIYERSAANLSLDFKITPKLILSLRDNYSKMEGEYFNIYTTMSTIDYSTTANRNGPTVSVQPESTLTRWVVTPNNTISPNSSLTTGPSRHRTKSINNLFTPRLEYTNGPLNITFRGAYTKARAVSLDAGEHMFRATGSILTGLGWIAGRPSEDSPTWTLTQTDGMDWRVPQNWARSYTLYDAINSNPEVTENEQFSGYLDITYARRVFGQPVTFKAGGGVRHNDYTYTARSDIYNFLGPTGRQVENVLPWTQNYIFDYKYGNISEQNWRADDGYELGRLYMAHPEWFQYDEVRSYASNMLLSRAASENIKAAYVEAISRYKAWQFNLGVRYETTTTKAQVTRMRPAEDITAAKSIASQELIDTGIFDDTASIAGINFKYYNGERVTRERDYGNLFLSGGLKYDITKNLRFQLSASQSILRPNYSNIAGVVRFYDTNYTYDVWVPNPILKPERATKYYAGLKYYLNPAGSVGISVYRLDIRDKQINGIEITEEQAEEQLGYPLRDAIDLVRPGTGSGGTGSGEPDESGDDNTDVTVTYTPISYRSTINVPGTRTVYGVTFDYDQQLLFLPGFLKGLGIFGSYTWSDMRNAQADEEIIGVIRNSANGGIKYRYKRFNVQLRASWQGDQLKSVTRPQPRWDWIVNDHIYQKSRIIWDLSGGFNLARDLDLVFSIRNVFNAPQILYSNERSRMHAYYDTGAICSVSLKGSF
jgi:TonB-dependent receptor